MPFAPGLSNACRLEVGDTADWKSALRAVTPGFPFSDGVSRAVEYVASSAGCTCLCPGGIPHGRTWANPQLRLIMRIIALLLLTGTAATFAADPPPLGRSPFTNRLGTNLPPGFTNRPGFSNLVRPGFPGTNGFRTNRFGPFDTNRGGIAPTNAVPLPGLTPPANPAPPQNPLPPPNTPPAPPGNPAPPSNVPLAPPKPLAPPPPR
ncbi:MAG: hypothetical protein QOF48_3651 [Verrucomicrobiota bacterium]|jgi:hypothetical protein